jgi:hypothetical protein
LSTEKCFSRTTNNVSAAIEAIECAYLRQGRAE